MKIVIVNSSDSGGGAALASYRLYEALKSAGHEVHMLVKEKRRTDPGIFEARTGLFVKQRNMADFIAERLRFLPYEKDASVRYNFSPANSGTDISRHPLVVEADIVHLHWFNQGFLSIASLRRLINSGKKIVWTLHDMWAFTGGCHYSRGCDHYKRACGFCHFLKYPSSGDLSHEVWNDKKSGYADGGISFVTCSHWLAGCARESGLLGESSVVTVPNPIDTGKFRPGNKTMLRQQLGLPQDKKIICFIAANIHDKRKGISFTVGALKKLYETYPEPDQIELLIIGNVKGKLDTGHIPFRVHLPGFIRDEQAIADYYAASDLFINTSLEDNLPNTIMEAMACGLPVAAFEIGGLGDMILNGENGIFVQAEDTEGMAGALSRLLSDPLELQRFSANAVASVTRKFSYAAVAAQYLEVYRDGFTGKP